MKVREKMAAVFGCGLVPSFVQLYGGNIDGYVDK